MNEPVSREEFDALAKIVSGISLNLLILQTQFYTDGIDDEEVCELRRLIVNNDGGDDMMMFHYANLQERLQVLRDEEDEGEKSTSEK